MNGYIAHNISHKEKNPLILWADVTVPIMLNLTFVLLL